MDTSHKFLVIIGSTVLIAVSTIGGYELFVTQHYTKYPVVSAGSAGTTVSTQSSSS